MVELKDLHLLTELSRHRHFAKAAEACHMSQPAFSMRIRALEERLGLPIVRRGNRFQGLTPEGQMIVDRARRMLDDARALEQEIAAARGEVTGSLRLGVVPTATCYAAALMARLHQNYARILVQLEVTTSAAIQQGLRDGTMDAGITYYDGLERTGLTVRSLYEESYVLIATPELLGDLAKDRDQITWAEAAGLRLSLLDPQMQNRQILDQIFAEIGAAPSVISEATGFMAPIAMARAGSGATIVPAALMDALGPLQGTRVLALKEPVHRRPICIATLKRQPELTTVRALFDLVSSEED